MRTVSTAEEDILNAAKYQVYHRLETETSSGAFQDLDSLGVGNWFEGARWDWSLDQPVPELLLSIRRDHGKSTEQSLAPLDEDSTLNRVPGSTTFTAVIDVGRELKLYTAATTVGGSAPASSAMDFVFHGVIDDVAWSRSPLNVTARGIVMSQLYDRWIESSSFVYSATSTDAIEDVLTEIIEDWTDLSTTVVWESSSPGFLINAYQQEKMRVLDAVTTIAQLIGWDLRERYDEASSAWRLRFEEPLRTATSSDKNWTFGPQHYFDVQAMDISRDDVRNVVSVIFGNTSDRKKIEVSSTSSIDAFGRRWMEIEEASNSAIDSSSEAEVLANAALNDLKDPAATHTIDVPYFWPSELQDYYEFEPNDIHYSTTQYLAVYGVTHEISPQRHRTQIRVRGQPAGQYLRWQDYPGGGGFPDGLWISIEDELNRPVATTESRIQVFYRDILLRWGLDTKSVGVEYSFLRPVPGAPADNFGSTYYFNTSSTDPESLLHTLQTSDAPGSTSPQGFWVNHTTSDDTLQDGVFFLTMTPWSEQGGSSGGGIAGVPQKVRVGDLIQTPYVGASAFTSSGQHLVGRGIVPGTCGINVHFQVNTSGSLVLHVTT